MAGGSPSTTLAEYLLVALILISLALEAALHRLERWIATRHVHLQAVLRNLYRELMVLGLVSFVFITYEASAKPPADTIASFEFAHVFIFLLAIVHTVVVLVSVLTSLSLSRRWRTMEQMDLVQYLELKEEFRRVRARRHERGSALWRRVRWWLPDPRVLLRYWRLHEIMAFHDIRFQFLYYRNLPEDFNFSAYLRKVKAVIFIDLVDAHWSLWAVFLIIVAADLIRRHFWDSARFEGAFAICAAITLASLAALLNAKIRRVYWALTKHPAVYFEDVSREAALSLSPGGGSGAPPSSKSVSQTRRSRQKSVTLRPRRAAAADSDSDDDDDDAAGQPRVLTGSTVSRVPSPPPLELAASASSATPPGSSPPLSSPPPSASPPDDTSASATPIRTSLELQFSEAGSRITNLVYSPEAHSGEPAGKRRQGGRRKPKRVPEPPVPTPDQLLQVAERHSLGPRVDAGSRRGSIELARDSFDKFAPSASPPASVATASAPGSRTESGTASVAESDAASGVVRVHHGRDVHLYLDEDAIVPAPGAVGEGRAGYDVRSASASWERRVHQGMPLPSMDADAVRGSRMSLDEGDARRRHADPASGRRSLDLDATGRGPVDDAGSGIMSFRRSQDSGTTRRSIDLAAAFPTRELGERSVPNKLGRSSHELDLELGEGDTLQARDSPDRHSGDGSAPRSGAASTRASKSAPNSRRVSKSRPPSEPRYVNPSLVTYAAEATEAREKDIATHYPAFVLALVPRLRRKASRAEKLFWFGSHRFFMWLVEFTLFFATVLLASAASAFSLLLLNKDETRVPGLAIAGFASAFACIVLVLLRISYVMKKYVFVLNNAGLVPEVLALQVIHNVHQKRQLLNEMYADVRDDASGVDSDGEASEAARERRRKFSRFFSTEAETSGYVPGESQNGDTPPTLLRRIKRRTKRRTRANLEDFPVMPDKAVVNPVDSD